MRAMEREVRYCTTEDGVSMGYTVAGEGPPLLVGPYFFESFTHDGGRHGPLRS